LFTEHTAGKHSASDDTLTIEADYHCAAFERGTQRATYSWTLPNGRLALRAEHDRCRERKRYLDGVVYRMRDALLTQGDDLVQPARLELPISIRG
jgi:hypothetical protein